jgi:outer membrane receptor for monomeric catechols
MSGAAVLGLAIPASAEGAMGARIDSPLNVYKTGVVVTGTISHWDSDAASAIFVAHIVQGAHVAIGKSSHVPAGATKFGLWATGELHPGNATGHGTAHITNKNGSTETYTWTVPVTLK